MKLKKLYLALMLAILVFIPCLFVEIVAADTGIVEVGVGDEKLYAIFNTVSSATGYNAYYKKSTDSAYTQIDSELVREDNSNIRVDVVGLAEGSYYLKFAPIISGVEDESSTIELKDINVSAYDRSGYAHFNYSSGVGAYNDDGTLKDGTVVVYVSESNKNTVTATINNSTYTGLTNILKAQRYSSVPLDIRILGTVGAATWNQIEYDPDGTYRASKNLPIENVIGANGEALPYQTLDEDAIISAGYNTLDTSTYSKLNNLTNKITYDSKDNEFDSYYNMLDVDYAENVTVEGIGDDAIIDQFGFTWKRSSYIEVRNLTFNNYTEDACSFQGDSVSVSKTTTSYDISNITYKNVWIHHNTFNIGKNVWDVSKEQDKHEGDGATDLKFQKNITIAYNHYYRNHKTGLVGGSDGNVTANVTFHHNWYQENQSRMPFARQANMHMYNNYYDSSTGTTMQVYAGGYAFIENCYFKNDKKTFDLNDKGYQTPAVKSYNNVFDGSKTTDPATIVSSRTEAVENGNVFNSSFDTDSSFFYYDSTNQKSDVEVMNSASELPTLLPTISGAGILSTTTYTIVDDESGDEPASTEPTGETPVYDNKSYYRILNEDFSSQPTINNTDGTPSSAGVYQRTDAADYTNNYLTYDDNGLYLYDNSDKTTTGYYMFESQYNTGVMKYIVEYTPSSANSKWNIVTFLAGTTNFIIGTNAKDSDKKIPLAYSLDGGTTMHNILANFTANTKYTITLTIDYDNSTSSIDVNGTTISGISYSDSIKGLQFVTAGSASRYAHVNSIVIKQEVDDLILGYQKGTYTSNNTSYGALRIIGKLQYGDVIPNLGSISSITINIDLVDDSGNVYQTYSDDIQDVYKSLSLTNGTVVAPEEENTRYYYSIIKEITSSHENYKINATTTITLTSGQIVECTGFSYEIV